MQVESVVGLIQAVNGCDRGFSSKPSSESSDAARGCFKLDTDLTLKKPYS